MKAIPMPTLAEPSQERLEETAGRMHSDCRMCGTESDGGFHLRFCVQSDGSIVTDWLPERKHGGYAEILHGGVIAALLDSAMTNALFARGVAAVTARLSVRYRRPVRLGIPLAVHGRLADAAPPLYNVTAEIRQEGRRMADASAMFFQAPNKQASEAARKRL